MKLESKIGKVNSSDEKIYKFLTDFNNFKELIPEDKIKDWESAEDSCSFTVDMVGKTGFKIVEKNPYKLVKLTNLEDTPYNFFFWVQLKSVNENETAVKLTMDVELNAMMAMMAKKPLQEFLDKLVDQVKKINFEK